MNKAGDVDASASIGPVKTPAVHISAAAADAPYKAAGLLAQTARDTVARGVADLSAQAEKAVPGLKVAFPQLAPPAKR